VGLDFFLEHVALLSTWGKYQAVFAASLMLGYAAWPALAAPHQSGDECMQETAAGRIHKLEVTGDTLTSRGGLAFFVKYVESIGIVGLLSSKFAGLKKSVKGVAVGNLFLQALYFLLDGTSRHLSYFDELQRDEGYRAVVEMAEKQMASSHAMKRFFGAFNIFHAAAFRWVLRELLVWRLQREQPRAVVMTLDTMVMDKEQPTLLRI
jgi:hypothetical protein